VPEFCVVLLEKYGTVLGPGSILGSERKHHVVKLAEGNSPQILAIDSLHEHKHILVAELAKLKVISEPVRHVLYGDAAQIVGVEEVESILEIEVVLQRQVDPEGLQVLAHENDLLQHAGQFGLLVFVDKAMGLVMRQPRGLLPAGRVSWLQMLMLMVRDQNWRWGLLLVHVMRSRRMMMVLHLAECLIRAACLLLIWLEHQMVSVSSMLGAKWHYFPW
jgi:hypothetical protein